jgi:hypothetical protein
LSLNVFRSRASRCQYMSARDREKLIRDYIWARDSYQRSVVEARRAYDELVRRGLIPADDQTPEQ